MGDARVTPRNPKAVLLSNPFCGPLRSMYDRLVASGSTSWNQVEEQFLVAMSEFDDGLPEAFTGSDFEKQRQSKALSAAL